MRVSTLVWMAGGAAALYGAGLWLVDAYSPENRAARAAQEKGDDPAQAGPQSAMQSRGPIVAATLAKPNTPAPDGVTWPSLVETHREKGGAFVHQGETWRFTVRFQQTLGAAEKQIAAAASIYPQDGVDTWKIGTVTRQEVKFDQFRPKERAPATGKARGKSRTWTFRPRALGDFGPLFPAPRDVVFTGRQTVVVGNHDFPCAVIDFERDGVRWRYWVHVAGGDLITFPGVVQAARGKEVVFALTEINAGPTWQIDLPQLAQIGQRLSYTWMPSDKFDAIQCKKKKKKKKRRRKKKRKKRRKKQSSRRGDDDEAVFVVDWMFGDQISAAREGGGQGLLWTRTLKPQSDAPDVRIENVEIDGERFRVLVEQTTLPDARGNPCDDVRWYRVDNKNRLMWPGLVRWEKGGVVVRELKSIAAPAPQ